MGACSSSPSAPLAAPARACQTPFSDVSILEALGDGSHAKVYKGQCKHGGGLCAMKVANRAPKSDKLLMEEASILEQLNHPHIVKLLGHGKGPRGPYMTMELCSGGDVFDLLERKGHLSEKEAAHVMRQLLEAVAHMHSHGICHRDLKEDNLLVANASLRPEEATYAFARARPEEELLVKVCDFGIARRSSSVCAAWSESLCTPSYAAPEVLAGNVGDEAGDMWSCGVILYMLLCGCRPFQGESRSEVLESVLSVGPRFDDAVWHGASDSAIGLIRRLLRTDKVQRYTAEEALAHPWVARQAPLGEPAVVRECLFEERPSAEQLLQLRQELDAMGPGGVLPWELTAALCRAGVVEDGVVMSQLSAEAANGNGLLDCSGLANPALEWPSLKALLVDSESFGLDAIKFSGIVDLLSGSYAAKSSLLTQW